MTPFVRALPLAASLVVAGLAGCSTERRPALPSRAGQVPSLVQLLDEAGTPLGVGAFLRTTATSAVLVGSPCPAGPLPRQLTVALGAERLLVERAEQASLDLGGPVLVVVEVPRGDNDLRPVGPAALPGPGDPVRVVTPGGGALLALDARVAEATGERVQLAALPRGGVTDGRAPGQRSSDACGAAVLTADGALLGFITGVSGDRPVVTPLGAIPGLLEAVNAPAGPDVLSPDDQALTLRVRVERAEGLPAITDGWGEPDFALQITVADQPLPPLPLWEEPRPLLVRARQAGPASIRLVERDVTLGAGEASLELSEPATFEALSPGVTTITFPLARGILERHPEARRGPRRARVVLAVERFDPDARSGADRTPLGATAYALGRVASGRLDLLGGDGSDLLAVDAARGGPTPVVALLLRCAPGALVAARAFPPTFEAPVLDLAPAPGRLLAAARALLPAGRSFVRVSSLEGPACAYHLLVAPSDDPRGLVRSLFRLVTRVAEDRLPYLESRAFAREVAVGLTFDAGLDPHVVSQAVLAELGHRTAEVRHLALNLLETHFPPVVAALDELYQASEEGARALDAGLLLAAQRPNEARTDDVLARATLDPDPLIKLRALAIALQVEDGPRRARLARSLGESDPTSLVRKALARADLGP